MLRALWTASTGMEAQQSKIDVISNNLANINTPGFKGSRADFADLLYQTIREPGTASAQGIQNPNGIQFGHGTRLVSVSKLFTDGEFQQTQNEMDLAIEGKGFFQIMQPNGDIAYSRSGSFRRNSDGQMVTTEGWALQPDITMPADATTITVGTDGTITTIVPGQIEPVELGQIQLAWFPNPAGLKSLGHNCYGQTDASGEPTVGTPGEDGLGGIAQGFLELSNVNLVEEMVAMIIAQRSYEISSKVITTADEMLQAANRVA